MSHNYLRLAIGVIGVIGLPLVAPLAGCGLISTDVTNFDITLPDKKFSIDTQSWQVNQSQADMLTQQSCSANPMVCSGTVKNFCTTGCSGICNTVKTCDLSLDVSVVQPVNLLTESPDLKTVSNQSVVKVAIDSVTYEITGNSLNVPTPDITVYVAPMSVVKFDSTNAQIKAIGTIPGVQAGQVTTAPKPIQFTATGKSDLQNIMGTFKTPFNILVGSSLLVTAGSPLPTGRLDAVVHVTAHAGL